MDAVDTLDKKLGVSLDELIKQQQAQKRQAAGASGRKERGGRKAATDKAGNSGRTGLKAAPTVLKASGGVQKASVASKKARPGRAPAAAPLRTADNGSSARAAGSSRSRGGARRGGSGGGGEKSRQAGSEDNAMSRIALKTPDEAMKALSFAKSLAKEAEATLRKYGPPANGGGRQGGSGSGSGRSQQAATTAAAGGRRRPRGGVRNRRK